MFCLSIKILSADSVENYKWNGTKSKSLEQIIRKKIKPQRIVLGINGKKMEVNEVTQYGLYLDTDLVQSQMFGFGVNIMY